MTEHQTEATPVDPTEEPIPSPTEPAATPPTEPPTEAPIAAAPHYLSIVAFTLGLAGVVSPGLASIGAIVLGHIALSKEPTGRTFAIIGLVAGYVVTGMFVLAMIIFVSIWGVVLSSILATVPFLEPVPMR